MRCKEDRSRSDDYISWPDHEHLLAEAVVFFLMTALIIFLWMSR